jgi:DNA-binding NarL/FixJ family response regulator
MLVPDCRKGAVSRIRILIGSMPRMLRDILEDAIGAQPDMEIVAPGEPADLPTAIERQQPDVVIIAQEGAGLNIACVELASAVRRLGVLVVNDAGYHARLMALRQIAVVDVSPRGLVETIRTEFVHYKDG